MKAWVLTRQAPIEECPLELVEQPTPQPQAHEVLVRVGICGICRTDLHIAEGDLAAGKKRLILGHEVVGVVDAVGEAVNRVRPGEKVGVTWLGRTCGVCKHCRAGRENYCADFRATGRDLDGGFAEYTLAHEDAVFALEGIRGPDNEVAPMLCAGVAGYCAFRLMNVEAGDRVGLYGFGPTAYYVLRVAHHLGIEAYVSSRSALNLERAHRHGAVWAGNAAEDALPVELDAAIVFPPAGQLVELALRRLKPGGVLVLAPVAMSTIEIGDYSAHLWGRDIRTLYNVNRRDAEEFLRLAREIDMSLGTEVFPFESCQDALIRVRRGDIRQANAAVRVCEPIHRA
jgi:propanol-preferring alcohol dehydrogenase